MLTVNNYVLIRPDTDHYEYITLESGLKWWLDTSFEKEKHSCTSGTILNLPETLRYPKGYDPTIEALVDDEVIFNYNDMPNAKKDGSLREEGLFLKYDFLYAVKRGEEVIPLNGWIIVEPCIDRIESTLIFIPEEVTAKLSEVRGKIRYAGLPIEDGIDYDLNVGDEIIFASHSSLPLQYEMHQIIDPGKQLYRMRYEDVLAKVIAE